MSTNVDLVRRRSVAATAAIENERPALESPVGHVRGVTIELVLTGAGQVHEATCYVERKTAHRTRSEREA